MVEPAWNTCNEQEMWHYVASHLESHGVSTVLVGGAAAAVHSGGAYRSGDIDLLIDSYPPPSPAKLDATMAIIGFQRQGRHYTHPRCHHLFVEFIFNALHIGKDYKIKPITTDVDAQSIRALSPTDSIKDRLTSFLYFRARECLDQAILIAKANDIHWASIETWAKEENTEMANAVEQLRLAIQEQKPR